jgi:hypothetical protein
MAIPVWHRLIDLQDHVAGALPFPLYFRRNVCEDAVDPGLEQSAEVVRHVAEAQFEDRTIRILEADHASMAPARCREAGPSPLIPRSNARRPLKGRCGRDRLVGCGRKWLVLLGGSFFAFEAPAAAIAWCNVGQHLTHAGKLRRYANNRCRCCHSQCANAFMQVGPRIVERKADCAMRKNLIPMECFDKRTPIFEH